jgi:outer membrane protein assembly factor BamA
MLSALSALLVSSAFAQNPTGEILQVNIEFVVPDRKGVKEDFIRSHIRLKVGDAYEPGRENEDVKNLMATGQLRNVRVGVSKEGDGVVLLYNIERTPKTG